jgi:hypothetical protein
MGGTQPPFMYQAVHKDDERFPATSFDPKAVTRASYESKKPKSKPDGPLVSINRHPEYDALLFSCSHSPSRRQHSTAPMSDVWPDTNNWTSALMVPGGRSAKYRPMSHRTKSWIKGMRVVQLCLRVLQAVAAVGLIVVTSMSGLMGWVMGPAVCLRRCPSLCSLRRG